MKKFLSQGIVLNRTNFGEADRIITFLTPEHGKVKAIAKGVRKSKSKLAGGLEIFSVSDLSFLVAKSEINTLLSSRLQTHYGNIVKDTARTNLGYGFIKFIDKSTQENPEAAYFELLKTSFEGLNDLNIKAEITSLWFNMHLLKLSGHNPNLRTDSMGHRLEDSKGYTFDLEKMHFSAAGKTGRYKSDHIKFLRLTSAASVPKIVQRVKDAESYANAIEPFTQSILNNYVQI